MKPDRGFSLIELVLVMLLTAILSVVAVGRLDLDAYDLSTAKGELKNAIRFAQAAAMARSAGAGYEVVTGANGFAVRRSGGATVESPYAAGPYSVTFSGVAIAPAGVLGFDGMGRPTASGGLGFAGNRLTLTLSAGDESEILQVEDFTGYVP